MQLPGLLKPHQDAVETAMAYTHEEGGEGRTVVLDLRDRPMSLERVAQGTVTLRIDPIGAPPVTMDTHARNHNCTKICRCGIVR